VPHVTTRIDARDPVDVVRRGPGERRRRGRCGRGRRRVRVSAVLVRVRRGPRDHGGAAVRTRRVLVALGDAPRVPLAETRGVRRLGAHAARRRRRALRRRFRGGEPASPARRRRWRGREGEDDGDGAAAPWRWRRKRAQAHPARHGLHVGRDARDAAARAFRCCGRLTTPDTAPSQCGSRAPPSTRGRSTRRRGARAPCRRTPPRRRTPRKLRRCARRGTGRRPGDTAAFVSSFCVLCALGASGALGAFCYEVAPAPALITASSAATENFPTTTRATRAQS